MKKNSLLFIFCTCLVYFQSVAQPDRLSEFAPMQGDWRGEGWMYKGNEKIYFSTKEKIRTMAQGACLVLEGVGMQKGGNNPDQVVHSAFAVISYAPNQNKVMMKGYKLNMEAPFISLRKNVWEWKLISTDGSQSTFTFDFSNDNQWIETGRYSRDGKTWQAFMEIQFLRDTLANQIPEKFELIHAIISRKQLEVKRLLRQGASMYVKDENGYTAIDYAVERYNPEAMKLLLIAMTDEFSLRPKEISLRQAILINDSITVSTLLNNGVKDIEIDLRSELGSLFLSLAALQGNVSIGKTLLNCNSTIVPNKPTGNCVQVNMNNNTGYTALPLSIRFGNISFTKLLLAAGADVNQQTKSKYQSTPLMEASRNNNAIVASLLLDRGALVNKRDEYGDHALNWGAFFGSYEFVKVLLEHGADCTVVGQSGTETAIDIAKREGHVKLVELLSHGCKTN